MKPRKLIPDYFGWKDFRIIQCYSKTKPQSRRCFFVFRNCYHVQRTACIMKYGVTLKSFTFDSQLSSLLTVYISMHILLSVLNHFLSCRKGEFVSQLRYSLVGDHLFYSRDLNAWSRGDIGRRNWMLVYPRGQRINFCSTIVQTKG